MDAPSMERVWRALLRPQIFFSAGGEPASAALSVGERRSIEGAGTRRTREFAAGRWHAKRALKALGIDAADLPRCADGAPGWPAGVVGSLSHAWHRERLVAIAAVAQSHQVSGVGVDLEPPGAIASNAWSTFLSPAELDKILALPMVQRGTAVSAFWCAKEAVAKSGGMKHPLREIEIAFDAGRCFDVDGHTGRIVQQAGWTFAAAMRFTSDRGRSGGA